MATIHLIISTRSIHPTSQIIIDGEQEIGMEIIIITAFMKNTMTWIQRFHTIKEEEEAHPTL